LQIFRVTTSGVRSLKYLTPTRKHFEVFALRLVLKLGMECYKLFKNVKNDSGSSSSLKYPLRLHSYFGNSLKHRPESIPTFQLLYTTGDPDYCLLCTAVFERIQTYSRRWNAKNAVAGMTFGCIATHIHACVVSK